MKKLYVGILVLIALAVMAQTTFKILTYPQFPHTSTLNANDLFLLWRGNTNYNIAESEFVSQIGISVTNVVGTNIYVNNAYITNLFSTTIITTNLYATNIFATTVNAVTNINNYDFSTNIFTTNLFATTVNAITNFNTFNYSTNLFSTNIYTTNLFATTVNNTTNISQTDITTNLFVTNIFNSTAYITNLYSTNVYTTNLFATTVNAVTNINNFSYTTNLFVTNITDQTINDITNISQFSYITNLYVTNLTVQNFNLTTNGFVLSYGGIGTNETWVGPTTFVDTNKSGVIDILDADGTTIIAGYDTNFNGFFGRGYAVSTNSWSGATNAVDLTHADTYYVSYIPVSLTGVSGKLGAYSSGVSLSISNAASTNITIDFTPFKTSDGTRNSTLTNATVGVFWIKYSPVWGTTQLVARPTFF